MGGLRWRTPNPSSLLWKPSDRKCWCFLRLMSPLQIQPPLPGQDLPALPTCIPVVFPLPLPAFHTSPPSNMQFFLPWLPSISLHLLGANSYSPFKLHLTSALRWIFATWNLFSLWPQSFFLLCCSLTQMVYLHFYLLLPSIVGRDYVFFSFISQFLPQYLAHRENQ